MDNYNTTCLLKFNISTNIYNRCSPEAPFIYIYEVINTIHESLILNEQDLVILFILFVTVKFPYYLNIRIRLTILALIWISRHYDETTPKKLWIKASGLAWSELLGYTIDVLKNMTQDLNFTLTQINSNKRFLLDSQNNHKK